MAYGKIKADTFVYDNSGSDVEVTLSSLSNKVDAASPTFTGTVTIPTPAANDNTTKAASTAYVQTELGDYLTTATATSTYAPKASPTFTGTPTVPGYATLASPTFTGTVNAAALTLSGNLTVNGTTTTIDSTTLNVEDKNIELGKVSTPTDTTADGGGITLKGASDKTFNWVNATDAWTSSEHIALGDNKEIKIGTGADFKIWHDGSHTRIGNSTGALNVRTDTLNVTNAANTENLINAVADGAVTLNHNGTAKLATSAAGVTVSGSVTDDKGNVRSIPAKSATNPYTLVASDAGKAVTTNGFTITIPNNVFSGGDAVTLVNNSSSDTTITRACTSLYLGSDGTNSASLTLKARTTATIYFTAGTTGYISGGGLS